MSSSSLMSSSSSNFSTSSVFNDSSSTVYYQEAVDFCLTKCDETHPDYDPKDVQCQADGLMLFIGLLLSVTGNLLNSFGYIIQKKGHVQVMTQAEETGIKPSFVKNKTWVLGFVTYTVGSLCHGSALAFGPSAVLTPMESITLVANTFLAPIYLNEKLYNRDIGATVLIMIGCTMAVLFGPGSDKDYTGNQLMKRYLLEGVIIMTAVVWSAVAVDYFFVKRVEKHCKERNIVQDGTMAPYGAAFLVISYTAIAGMFGSYNVLLTKSFFELLWGMANEGQPFTWVFPLVFMVFMGANLGAEMWKQRALGLFGALYVVPIYQVIVIVGGITVGAVYFEEFECLSADFLALFCVGIACTLVGVYILATTEGQKLHSLSFIVKHKVIPMLRGARMANGAPLADTQLNIETIMTLHAKALADEAMPTKHISRVESKAKPDPATAVVVPQSALLNRELTANITLTEVEQHASVSGWGQLCWQNLTKRYVKRSYLPLRFQKNRVDGEDAKTGDENDAKALGDVATELAALSSAGEGNVPPMEDDTKHANEEDVENNNTVAATTPTASSAAVPETQLIRSEDNVQAVSLTTQAEEAVVESQSMETVEQTQSTPENEVQVEPVPLAQQNVTAVTAEQAEMRRASAAEKMVRLNSAAFTAANGHDEEDNDGELEPFVSTDQTMEGKEVFVAAPVDMKTETSQPDSREDSGLPVLSPRKQNDLAAFSPDEPKKPPSVMDHLPPIK